MQSARDDPINRRWADLDLWTTHFARVLGR
jgi:hypothetical protein